MNIGEEGKERKVRRRGKDRRGGLERREEWEIDGKGIEEEDRLEEKRIG